MLKNNITKYDKVYFYIEFKKQISENEYEVIKTEVKTLNFNSSFDVDKEIADYFTEKYLDSDYKNSIPTFDEIKYFILNKYCKIQHP